MRNVKGAWWGLLATTSLFACGDDAGTGGGGDGGGEEATSTTTAASMTTSGTGSSTSSTGTGGGPECELASECDDSDACTTDTCDGGACSNVAIDPNDNNACTTDTCNAATGVENAPIDRDDMNVCTFDSCDPAIGPVNVGEVVLFSEDFADNAAGWALGQDWQIGPAAVSDPPYNGSTDPAQDHTQLGDNGIAGILIGANVSNVVDGAFAYLESPIVDTSTAPVGSAIELRLWRFSNLDYQDYMTTTIEVFDGTSWTVLWDTGSTEEVLIDSDVPGYGQGWFPMSFDLTPYANPSLRVRFGFDVGNPGVYDIGGPNYDDVSILSVPFAPDDDQCTVAGCDAASGATTSPFSIVDDGIACTTESCDTIEGITHDPDDSVCDDGNACTNDSCDVELGCVNDPIDPNDNNACTIDACDQVTGVSNTPINADDGNPCTIDTCDPGSGVANTPKTAVFAEDFSDNSAGWTLGGNEWAIGAAAASNCGETPSCTGQDTATDHTATADNGVAGPVLGGCYDDVAHGDYCLTSPVMDTTTEPGSVTFSLWRNAHADYPAFHTSRVEVFNGSAWVVLWAQPDNLACLNDPAWVNQSFDVTAHKNAQFQARFCYAVNGTAAWGAGGITYDDITVYDPACVAPL